MNQRQAVFLAVCTVLGREPGKGEKVELSKNQLKQVHHEVEQMFLRGEVQLRASDTKPRDAEWIRKYVPGLVNNWLRKDKALNGNVTYQTKNPGSRTGSGDATLMALKSLSAVVKDPAELQKIQDEIVKRKAELEKVKQKPINLAALPEKFRHLVPQE